MRSFEADEDVQAHLKRLHAKHNLITPHINRALREYFARESGWVWKKRLQ